MKTSFRFFAVGLALSLVLISCDKESLTHTEDNEVKGGLRTITISFAENSTKTILGDDGVSPAFAVGDKILVTNGNGNETCAVTIDGEGVATINTKLTGSLDAVYPASAARLDVDQKNITGIIVPNVQDGTFASANICRASIEDVENPKAVFQNQTAVFAINPPYASDAKIPLYVEVITGRPKIANTILDRDHQKMNKVHATVANSNAQSVFYLSVLVPSSTDADLPVQGGLRICDISFADGYNIKTLKDNPEKIVAGIIYYVSNVGWSEPYVEVKGLKLATRNVGAENPEDYGEYFSWGEVKGHTADFSANEGEEFAADFSSFDFSDKSRYTDNTDPALGFDICNSPYWIGHSYCKYAQGGETLSLADDAANVNWGGSWRMPSDEIRVLADGKIDETTYIINKNVNITFPTAGLGYGVKLYKSSTGNWLLNVGSNLPRLTSLFKFSSGTFSLSGFERSCGYSVRPVSD